MKTQLILAKLLIVTAVLLFASPPNWSQSITVKVPYITEHGELLIKATINGKDGYLVLDTGAVASAVDLQVYGSGKLQKGHAVLVNGTHVKIGIGTVDLKIANLDMPDVIVVVAQKITSDADGLLGEDVLSRFKRVTVDYTNKTVEFEI